MSIFTFRRARQAETGTAAPRRQTRSMLRWVMRKFFLGFTAASIAFANPMMGCNRSAEKPAITEKSRISGEEYQKLRLGLISHIISKSAKPQKSLVVFGDILEGRNFKPEMLSVIKLFLDKDTRLPKREDYIYKCLSVLRKLLDSKNFCPELMDAAKVIAQNSDPSHIDALSSLGLLLEEKNFNPAVFGIASRILKGKGKRQNKILINFAKIKEYDLFLEKFEEAQIMVRSAGPAAFEAFDAFSSMILYNPDKIKKLDISSARRLGELFHYAYKLGGKRYRRAVLSALTFYSRNKSMRLSLFNKTLVNKSYRFFKYLMDHPSKSPKSLSLALFQNPSFDFNMISIGSAKKMVAFFDLLFSGKKKNTGLHRFAWSIFRSPVFNINALDGELAKKIRSAAGRAQELSKESSSFFQTTLENLMQHPSFSLGMIDETFVERQFDLISLLRRNAGVDWYQANKWMFFFYGNPNFRMDMLDTIKYVTRKFGKESNSIMMYLEKIIQSPHFSNELWETTTLVLREANKRDIYLLMTMESILSNKNFNPKMIALIGRIAKRTHSNVYRGLESFRSVLNSKGIDQDKFDERAVDELSDIVNLTMNKHGSRGGFLLYCIDGMLEGRAARMSTLPFFRNLIRLPYAASSSSLLLLKRLWNNPSFDPDILDDGFARSLISIARRFKDNRKGNTGWKQVSKILEHKNFRPSDIYFIDGLLAVPSRYRRMVLDIFASLLEKKRYSPELVRGERGAKLSRKIKQTAIGRMRNKTYPSLLFAALKNPGFDAAKFTDPGFNHWLSGRARKIDEELGSYSNIGMFFLSNLMPNPNFRMDALDDDLIERLFDMLERILKQKISDSSLLLALAFKNRNFKVNEFDTPFVDQVLDFESNLNRKMGDRSKYATKVLTGLLLNENFNPHSVNDGLALLLKRFVKVISKDASEQDTGRRIESLDAVFRFNRHLPGNLKSILDSYRAAENLARSLRLNHKDPILCLNFAYAIHSIGTKRTKELHELSGILYFMRFTPGTLRLVQSNMKKKSRSRKPTLLAIFAREDDNGAFYREGLTLERLTRHYNVIIKEVGSESQFYLASKSVKFMYGAPKVLLLAGHGSTDGIALGSGEDGGNSLDLSDKALIAKMKQNLGPRPLVILISCSTGQHERAVGGVLSKYWGATLYAPVFPSAFTSIHLDRNGKIIGVSYNVPSKEFINGRRSF